MRHIIDVEFNEKETEALIDVGEQYVSISIGEDHLRMEVEDLRKLAEII